MLDVKKLLVKLLKQPHIVDHGVSNSVYWYKLSNGMMYCLGMTSFDGSVGYFTHNFPVAFKAGTNVKSVATVEYISGTVVGIVSNTPSTTKIVGYVRNVNGQNISSNIKVNWMVWGEWK